MKTNTHLVKRLVALLQAASNAYYNSDAYYKASPSEVPTELRELFRPTRGVISDALYDKLESRLRQLDSKHSYLKQTGAPVKNKKLKIELPFPMPSLSKIKEQDVTAEWLKAHPGPYMVSAKLDGVSIGLRFRLGTSTNRLGFTKGRDGKGGNISFMLDSLHVPDYNGTLDVRGEVIIRKDVFARKWKRADPKDKTRFENPRAMAAGITNRDELHPGLKDADVVLYDVISSRGIPSQQLKLLARKGFNVVLHKVYNTLTADMLPGILASMRKQCPYELDGLVIIQDRKHPAPEADNPDYAVAYKDPDAYEMADVEVLNVEWNATRTGLLFPRINIVPTRIGGTTVTYCSGKSGMTIKTNAIGPGAVIRVQRAGDVIPDFVETVKRVQPQMPTGRKGTDWQWNGENIDLIDRHSTSDLLALEHFFTVIGVENFKAATLQKFVDAGFDTVPAICNLKKRQWQAIPGTNKLIGDVYDQLQERLNGIQLSTLMYASGVFGRSMGQRRFDSLLKELPRFLSYADLPVSKLTRLIDEIHGFDQITAEQMAKGVKPFLRWLRQMPPISYKVQKPKAKGNKMAGEYVVFTGVRDADLQQAIADNGGEVGDSKTKMTILIAKDPNGTTGKLADARAKGITPMTVDQFKRKYKL